MNEQNLNPNEPIQSSKTIWITIIAVTITAFIVGGGVYAWQRSSLRSTEQSLQQQITDLQNQITSLQKPAQPIVTNPEAIEAPTQSEDETTNWKTYQSDKYGFSFSYPSNFQIITDKIQVEYIGHPKGFNWYRIELTDASKPEKPFMRFETDPDGYGPFFADKTYQITENNIGKIIIGAVNTSDSENSNDGKILIIPNMLESSNGHSYYWQFSYSESETDYEPLFKQILATFKFIK